MYRQCGERSGQHLPDTSAAGDDLKNVMGKAWYNIKEIHVSHGWGLGGVCSMHSDICCIETLAERERSLQQPGEPPI